MGHRAKGGMCNLTLSLLPIEFLRMKEYLGRPAPLSQQYVLL
jgi:hypothetical protein